MNAFRSVMFILLLFLLVIYPATSCQEYLSVESPDICFERIGDVDCYFSFTIPLSVSLGSAYWKGRFGDFSFTSYINLPVMEVGFEYPPYADFCSRNPRECDAFGKSVISFNEFPRELFILINQEVDADIKFAEDREEYNKEDYWDFPVNGRGDCEDIALEKRRRLASLGIPRAALRLIVGQHKRSLYSHAILSIETTEGTFILLENLSYLPLWHQIEYNLEMRERSDGNWDRYDQRYWIYRKIK